MTDFDDLVEANRRFQADFPLAGLEGRAAAGLAVLTCIDTRIDPLGALGLAPGDAKILRNAGARVTDDAVRSLALAAATLGVVRIAVIAHTDCALTKHRADDLRAAVAAATGAAVDGWDPLAVEDLEGCLAADVEALRASPLIPDGVVVGGFVYDVATGALAPLS